MSEYGFSPELTRSYPETKLSPEIFDALYAAESADGIEEVSSEWDEKLDMLIAELQKGKVE